MSCQIQLYHELQTRTQNVNVNLKCKPKNEYDYRNTFTSLRNITTCQDMSHETYFNAW